MYDTILLTYAGLSVPGRVRSDNQDRWFADVQDGIYLVADGIANNPEGGLAATIIVEILPSLLKQELRNFSGNFSEFPLQDVLTDLSDRLYQQTQHQPRLEGMGSTIVVALIQKSQVLISHLGDSRAYLWRNKTLQQLTQDHCLAKLLLDCNELSEREAAHHPSRHQLTRYAGMPVTAQPDLQCLELQLGDQILLCSDGLTNMLNHDQIITILNEQTSPQVSCHRLIEWANALGGKDNITCTVIAVM
jgi:PPM family protein phosphatase